MGQDLRYLGTPPAGLSQPVAQNYQSQLGCLLDFFGMDIARVDAQPPQYNNPNATYNVVTLLLSNGTTTYTLPTAATTTAAGISWCVLWVAVPGTAAAVTFNVAVGSDTTGCPVSNVGAWSAVFPAPGETGVAPTTLKLIVSGLTGSAKLPVIVVSG